MATEDATIMIKLQSSDKKVFEVPLKVAQKSNLIKTMLEDLGMEGEDELVPLPNVPGETLENVLKWATQHQVNINSNFACIHTCYFGCSYLKPVILMLHIRRMMLPLKPTIVTS